MQIIPAWLSCIKICQYPKAQNLSSSNILKLFFCSTCRGGGGGPVTSMEYFLLPSIPLTKMCFCFSSSLGKVVRVISILSHCSWVSWVSFCFFVYTCIFYTGWISLLPYFKYSWHQGHVPIHVLRSIFKTVHFREPSTVFVWEKNSHDGGIRVALLLLLIIW